MARTSDDTRQRLLAAARSVFARRGYKGASVAAIVSLARVTKPTLYYHFGSKAGLHETLVTDTLDTRYRLMCDAATVGGTLDERLRAVLAACFRHAHENRELTRICFAALFATPGEAPHQARFLRRGMRNFEFVHELLRVGARNGELRTDLSTHDLATAIYSRIVSNSLAQVIQERVAYPADAHATICLFLDGARAR